MTLPVKPGVLAAGVGPAAGSFFRVREAAGIITSIAARRCTNTSYLKWWYCESLTSYENAIRQFKPAGSECLMPERLLRVIPPDEDDATDTASTDKPVATSDCHEQHL